VEARCSALSPSGRARFSSSSGSWSCSLSASASSEAPLWNSRLPRPNERASSGMRLAPKSSRMMLSRMISSVAPTWGSPVSRRSPFRE